MENQAEEVKNTSIKNHVFYHIKEKKEYMLWIQWKDMSSTLLK